MKHFAKLALVSAIALSSSAFAMEAMEDEALAETTGQDGVTISITPPSGGITMSTVIHDTDPTVDGAIVIGNPLAAGGHTLTSVTTPVGQAINVLIDATGDVDSGTGGSQAALLIGVSIPTGTVINTGSISAAQSNGAGVAVTNQTSAIMDNVAITLGATTLDMTLGNEVASGGQMMQLNTTMTGGLSLANFALRDANGGGTGGSAIRATNISINNAGASTDLAVNARIDVVPTGLQMNMVTLGTGGMDMSITGLKLGDTAAAAIGNVDVIGLNLAGTLIRVAGH